MPTATLIQQGHMNLFARDAPATHNGKGDCPEIAGRNLALEWALSYNALTNLVFMVLLVLAHQILQIECASKPHCLVIKLAAAWIPRPPNARIRIHLTHLAGMQPVLHHIANVRSPTCNTLLSPTCSLPTHSVPTPLVPQMQGSVST